MTSTKLISDFGIAKLKIRVCGEPLKNRRKENKMENYTIKTLAKDLKESVDWLVENDCGCTTLKLDDRLAVCIGWSDGFDPDDGSVIHSKTEPTYAICAAIKVWTSDDMRTDFEYINMPWYEDGSVYDTECLISPDENYELLAENFLMEYRYIGNFDIDEKGMICEHRYLVSAFGTDDSGCSVGFEREIGWFNTYERAYERFVRSQHLDWSGDFGANNDLSQIEVSIEDHIKNGKGKGYYRTLEKTVIYR